MLATQASPEKIVICEPVQLIAPVTDTASMVHAIADQGGLEMTAPRKCAPTDVLVTESASMRHVCAPQDSPGSIVR